MLLNVSYFFVFFSINNLQICFSESRYVWDVGPGGTVCAVVCQTEHQQSAGCHKEGEWKEWAGVGHRKDDLHGQEVARDREEKQRLGNQSTSALSHKWQMMEHTLYKSYFYQNSSIKPVFFANPLSQYFRSMKKNSRHCQCYTNFWWLLFGLYEISFKIKQIGSQNCNLKASVILELRRIKKFRQSQKI